MGKKGQKGQKGFTIASKSNHSNQSFVCRRRKSLARAKDGGAIAEIILDTSFDSMSSLTADDPPQLLYCQGISNKQSFFQPHVMAGLVYR